MKIIIEVNDSVLFRRGIMRNPTSAGDTRDTIWIVGVVDRTNDRNFFVVRVSDRRIISMTSATVPYIRPGSILNTDEHASYPSVSRYLNLRHRIVNHSVGFGAADGTHTNNIKWFWGHMKSTMRKENGVQRDDIDNWLVQYTFKRRYVLGSSSEEFARLFVEILKLFFELNH